jgi:hypothetical protein
MGLRSELLAELVREVLGPRNGPFEEMEASPLDEYLTGVLQPAGVRALEADGEADRLPEEAESGEEDTDAGGIPPVVFTPAMDPRMRPSSMGLSFRVRVPAGGAPVWLPASPGPATSPCGRGMRRPGRRGKDVRERGGSGAGEGTRGPGFWIPFPRGMCGPVRRGVTGMDRAPRLPRKKSSACMSSRSGRGMIRRSSGSSFIWSTGFSPGIPAGCARRSVCFSPRSG